MGSPRSTDSKDRTISSIKGSSLGLPSPCGGDSGFLTIRGVRGGGTAMNSMEEEVTQLESEVFRKRLRQPKGSEMPRSKRSQGEREGVEGERKRESKRVKPRTRAKESERERYGDRATAQRGGHLP